MKRLVLTFHGHFQRDDLLSYAMGDDIPVFAHGNDYDDALERFKQGVALFMECLADEGLLDRFVKEGSAPIKLSATTGSRPFLRVERNGESFEVELAGIP